MRPEVVSSLAEDDEFGLLLPSGEINWSCPCLGGMADGPCGQEFKDSFSCFHYRSARLCLIGRWSLESVACWGRHAESQHVGRSLVRQ